MNASRPRPSPTGSSWSTTSGPIPFDRFRLTGSRDYRRPPEACITIEPDGVSMALDPARSDLMVDAELGRFADEIPPPGHSPDRVGEAETRRYVVTPASLRRGMNRGVNAQQLADWYERRTGSVIPPAVRLLLAPRASRVPPLETVRLTVLNLPSAELLDGLLQHPATRPWLGDRLGSRFVAIPEENLPSLQKALKELGINLEIS